jgi:drug/metabolite transporter (DMT)-like permease
MSAAPVLAATATQPVVSRAWLGLLCGVSAAVLFSGKAVLVRLAYAHGGEATALMGLRMAASLPFFAAIAWWFARRDGRLPIGDTVRLLLLGILGYHLASWLDLEGLRFIDAAFERVVLYMYPTLVLAVAVLRGRNVFNLRLVIALLATYGGILLTWGDRITVGSGSGAGVALVAASAVVFAIHMVLTEDLVRKIGGVRAMAVSMLGACATTIVHALIAAPVNLLAPNAPVVSCGLALALTGTVIPVLLFGMAVARLGSARAAMVGCVAPAMTALIGWMTLGEHLGALGWTGIVVTTLGAILIGQPRKPA